MTDAGVASQETPPSLLEALASRIWMNPTFQVDYQQLTESHLAGLLGIQGVHGDFDRGFVQRILQAATSLAGSQTTEHREAAYRIATAGWRKFGGEYDGTRDIAHLVLGRLGNFPATTYLYRGNQQDERSALPPPLWREVHAHQERNSVRLTADARIVLTDFQRKLWEVLESGSSAAVTAPTSAGKSFALQRFLASRLIAAGGWALYLVPTRALINQVSAGLTQVLGALRHRELAVSSIPIPPDEMGAASGVYVLTQERLQVLLEAAPELVFGTAIVDEAQMIADGARGVLLQGVLERLKLRNPEMQFLFGSPQTANPELFGKMFAIPGLDALREAESPVAQNLIYVDTDALNVRRVTVEARVLGRRRALGTIELERGAYDSDQTLAQLSWTLARGEKSLVYAGGQAKCEKIAGLLMQLEGEGDLFHGAESDALLREFSDFLKEHVHPEYLLCESVLSGVAFHYGNMPALVRKTVEELFADGHLRFLVCTSTLLHGVNLPAKNLFLSNPTKGRDFETGEDVPISSLDFWNLAGRAGRLGKDFEGNVFLIDVRRWQAQPEAGPRSGEVTPALTSTVVKHNTEFIEFLNDKSHKSGQLQEFENVFMKLLNDQRSGLLEASLAAAWEGAGGGLAQEAIDTAIKAASASLDVPDEVLRRNVSVSAYRQQRMLDYLVGKIRADGPTRFVPVHPLRPWEEAIESYRRMFKRIHSQFEEKPGRDRSEFFFAPLALLWMKGRPLRQLIDEAIAYRRRRGQRRFQVATVIREVLANVENDLRFRYVKYTSCYLDLLRVALERTAHPALRESIPSVPLYLELGASSKSMVSFIGMGLSRTSAGVLAEAAANKEMDRAQASRWLSGTNLSSLGISPIVSKEIAKVNERI